MNWGPRHECPHDGVTSLQLYAINTSQNETADSRRFAWSLFENFFDLDGKKMETPAPRFFEIYV